MMKEGRLKFADPWTTAMHWKGLNEWDLLEKHLLSAEARARTRTTSSLLQPPPPTPSSKVYAAPSQPGEVAL